MKFYKFYSSYTFYILFGYEKIREERTVDEVHFTFIATRWKSRVTPVFFTPDPEKYKKK